jgi:hypothetical protein
MKNILLPIIIIITLLCVSLSGCNNLNNPTAGEIITRTLAAMRNVTSYYYAIDESLNNTIDNQSKTDVDISLSFRSGSINVTQQTVTYTFTVNQTNATLHRFIRQIGLLANHTAYIGFDNNSDGTITWMNNSLLNAQTAWQSWSLLDYDAETLTGQSRSNPNQRNPVNAQRINDATINSTPCYVITVRQGNTVPAGRAMNTTYTSLHTYYIDKTTYHILTHTVDYRSQTLTDATSTPPYQLRMKITAQDTVRLTGYNTNVTINPPHL